MCLGKGLCSEGDWGSVVGTKFFQQQNCLLSPHSLLIGTTECEAENLLLVLYLVLRTCPAIGVLSL